MNSVPDYGDIAQLARALGSYPGCHWFKSSYRYHIWPVGQAVKTPPFHGGIMGSIPVRVTKNHERFKFVVFYVQVILTVLVLQFIKFYAIINPVKDI